MAVRQNKGYDIVTKTLFEQIFRLEDLQEKAIRGSDDDTVLKASEIIVKAISEIDRHDKELEEENPLKEWLMSDRVEKGFPPSPKLLEAAVKIYGFEGIDGFRAGDILEKIYNAERIYWARS